MLERIASGQVDPRASALALPRLAAPASERTFVGRRAELAQLRTGIGPRRRRGNFVDQVIAAKARHAYEARVDDLECELSLAEGDGEPERVLELRDELARLERELARGVALGGRSRPGSDVERARISVTRAIRLARGRSVDVAPDAGRFLALRIRTGTYCCYSTAEQRWPSHQPLRDHPR